MRHGLAIPRSRGGLSRLAFALGVVTIAFTAAAIPLTVLSAATPGLPLLPFAIVGYVVARRQPENPVGWALFGLGFVFLVAGDAGQYSVLAFTQGYHLPLPGWPRSSLRSGSGS